MAPQVLSQKELWDNTSRVRSYAVTAAYQCDNCSKLLLADVVLESDPGSRNSDVFETLDQVIKHTDLVTWLPRSGEAKEFADVPDHIASAASEVHECFSIGAYRGALSLSRAVVEATAKHLGINGGQLYAKINQMVTGGHLRSATGEMAHEIRHWGNDMAHGDFAAPISREEAESVLELMGEVLQEVFQGPARLQRVQQLRQAAADGQP